MTAERRAAALVDRLRALDASIVDALLDEVCYSSDPLQTLGRAFGITGHRRDSLHRRDLWLLELSRCEPFAGPKVTHQARAMAQFLKGYQRTKWLEARRASSCPHASGPEACAWHVWRWHTAVGPDRREISGPPAWQTIYGLLKRFSERAVDLRTEWPDVAGRERPTLKVLP